MSLNIISWLLDRLGVGSEGVVVVHAGGVYENKRESLERFKKVLRAHPLAHRKACGGK
ncbi:MAG: hypothetical protein ABDH29_03970 [Aquificaceae bacterium]